MPYTNLSNLPDSLVRALMYDDYDYNKAGHISVTGLIQPPRIRQLTRRHRAEITEDVSDLIWRVIGSIGHAIIERNADANTFTEERLSMECLGWKVTGKVDLMRIQGNEYAIDDMKFRSVWAAKDLKPEDERQLNLYALLARHNGFDVRHLRIISVLRDWSKPRAAREKDYPRAGAVLREIPLWTPEQQQEYLERRVTLHQMAEAIRGDDDLLECTDEETWRRPDKWALKKKGNKRAIALFDNEKDASACITSSQLTVEHRPGSYPRCEQYCAVASWCSVGRERKARANGQTNSD